MESIIAFFNVQERNQPSFYVVFDRFQRHPMIYLTRDHLNSPLQSISLTLVVVAVLPLLLPWLVLRIRNIIVSGSFIFLLGVHMAGLIFFILRHNILCDKGAAMIVISLSSYLGFVLLIHTRE